MSHHPFNDGESAKARAECTAPSDEAIKKLVRIFARSSANEEFEDLIRVQNDGKLKPLPKPD